MPLTKLEFRPGISRERTRYSETFGWFDSDKVRFRDGLPEKIGGWQKLTTSTYQGTARVIYPWTTLSGDQFYAIGTHLKFYLSRGGEVYDITPTRRTAALGSNPIETVSSGSGQIKITDVGHGGSLDSFVTLSGAVGFDGLTADEINQEFQISSIIDTDTYTVDTAGSATAGSIAGGGASVTAEYEIGVGLDEAAIGLGYGIGEYGDGLYSSPPGTLSTDSLLRIWSVDNYGEDLIINPWAGGIYRWDASTGFTAVAGVFEANEEAQELSGIAGAIDPPTVARQILVSNNDRHLIAFACDENQDGNADLLLIRWSDQENLLDWAPTTLNTSGSLRLGSGSQIIAARETSQEILIWTDSTLHSMRFIGPPYIFGQQVIARNTSLISPNSVGIVDDVAYWMGNESFYVYDGRIRKLSCTVEDYIFRRMNYAQRFKIAVGLNRQDGEIWWFYPSTTNENDSYVVYNYEQQVWYIGSMIRTYWVDRTFEPYPIASSTDGYLYTHENGIDDGSTTPSSAVTAYIESKDFEIGDGQQFQFIRRLIPDIEFHESTAETPTVTMTLTPRDFPGEAYDTGDQATETITRSATVPIQQFDKQKHIRVRGRAMKLRIESNAAGVEWHLGVPRIDVRPDGKR